MTDRFQPSDHRSHPEAHLALLHACMAGDVAPDAPELRERLRTCGACRTHLAQLREVSGLLEGALHGERRVTDVLRGRSGVPPEAAPSPAARERAAQTLRALAASDAKRRADPSSRTVLALRSAATAPAWSGSRRPSWGLALRLSMAAASIAAVGWFVRWLLSEPRPQESDVLLGSNPMTEVAVERTGSGWTGCIFRWNGQYSSLETFEVCVWRAGAPLLDNPEWRSEKLTSTEWTPDEARCKDWPSEIEWQVRVYDGSGSHAATRDSRRMRASSGAPPR